MKPPAEATLVEVGEFLTSEAKLALAGLRRPAAVGATFLVQPAAWTAIVNYSIARGKFSTAPDNKPSRRSLMGIPVQIIGTDLDAPFIRLVVEPAVMGRASL